MKTPKANVKRRYPDAYHIFCDGFHVVFLAKGIAQPVSGAGRNATAAWRAAAASLAAKEGA